MPVYEAKPNMSVLVSLIVVGVVLVVGVGIILATGGTLSPSPPSSQSSTSTLPANSVEVTMQGDGNGQNYHPALIVVVIGVNNTVVWVNNDNVAHTVTARSVPSGATMFNSGNLNPGQTFEYTFTVPGNYTYYCQYHPWMVGKVVVLAGASSQQTSSSSGSSTS
ncbi:MAG: cupredoxin domain-containing protein [Thermoprotei archaeon]